MDVSKVVKALEAQKKVLDNASSQIAQTIRGLGQFVAGDEPVVKGRKKGKRKLSPAARKKIADAAKARWAAKKAAGADDGEAA